MIGADEVMAVLRDLLPDQRGEPGVPLDATNCTLDDFGITGVDRMLVIAQLEAHFGITFPADLVSAIETVDDLIYYVGVKVEHRPGAALTSIEE